MVKPWHIHNMEYYTETLKNVLILGWIARELAEQKKPLKRLHTVLLWWRSG